MTDPCGNPPTRIMYPPMDPIGWYIATLHQLLGHDKAAAALGVPPGDPATCLICAYEHDPTDARRRDVLAALAPRKATP